jgi:hypothetical protein
MEGAPIRTIIGIVGYYGFVRGYPLGPELMERLRALPWPSGVDIREMNWGPVAIVQDFQASDDKPERVVLVGALDRGLATGTVSCRRWAGGILEVSAVQRRMFEAVTGVISLDNLLVIGAHFGVWPASTFTVELQWPEAGISDLVLDEIEITRGTSQVIGERPLTPENELVVQRLVELIHRAALDIEPSNTLLTVEQLTPAAAILHHRFYENSGLLQ